MKNGKFERGINTKLTYPDLNEQTSKLNEQTIVIENLKKNVLKMEDEIRSLKYENWEIGKRRDYFEKEKDKNKLEVERIRKTVSNWIIKLN